ncbi:MAG: hypothetical protein K0R29_1389 [Pseudobdellovibrio sp.]|nr:hypothetical protein [Pseudobdellovibrio sp.]
MIILQDRTSTSRNLNVTKFNVFKNISLSVLACAFTVLLTTNCTHFSKKNELMRDPQSLSADSPSVSVYFGQNVPPTIKTRITQLLQSGIPNFEKGSCSTNGQHIDLIFGNATNSLISAQEKASMQSSEGFKIKTAANPKAPQNCLIISVDGKSDAFTTFNSSRGVGYGAYAVLQDLGYKFLHPLRPDKEALNLDLTRLSRTSRTEEPYWPKRGLHLHTMHPLELGNLLNGWGVSGPNDKAGWEQMLPYWSSYLEWMTAHKQNEVEWSLLWTPEAGDFNQSAERQNRLKQLNMMAKSWGVEPGLVVGVRFVQQNSFTLLRTTRPNKNSPETKAANRQEVISNMNWILQTGVSSVGGEMGGGEFSSGDPSDTVDEMNYLADHLAAQNPPVHYRVKIHVSQGQSTKLFKDPMTNRDLNFNYLPLYANGKVGVMPHTVQMYSLTDPAPTYDNKDFTDILRFIKMASSGMGRGERREVLFYPETAYWVSYDVDVPLFLPAYPYRRVEDLRMIALDERSGDMKRSNSRMSGQMFFSSGWEFGFWFNDVITAEAAWNPHVEAANAAESFQKVIADTFRLNERTQVLAQQLSTMAQHQHDLLIKGLVNGQPPKKVDKRNGIAYLAGVETYDELPMFFREYVPKFLGVSLPLTQPNKFREDWAFKRSYYMNEGKYNKELKPLLVAMATIFQNDAASMRTLAQSLSGNGLTAELSEFADGSQITANRAHFVMNLWEARLAQHKRRNLNAEPSFQNLQTILSRTLEITERRKSKIPMLPQHRPLITGWENANYDNPTDYHYGYVWTSYNLMYWKREYNKLIYPHADGITCYMNTVKPSEIVGQKIVSNLERRAIGLGIARSCFTIPASEPNVNAGW